MAATVHGDVTHGAAAESGMFIQSADFDIKAEEKWIADEDGDDVAGALYNIQATFSLSGVKKVGEAINAKIAAAFTAANAVTYSDYITGYTTGGLTYVSNVKLPIKNDDFEMLDLSGGFKPSVSVA